MSEETYVYTACPGWGDHDYCALKTIVKDGVIVRTERVIYSDPEEPDGHICQKGCLACRQPYDPERLTTPLKRVGERGEGKWEEITWDQALDEIGAKLCEIREKYGPQSASLWCLPAGAPPANGFEWLFPMRFANLFGMTNMLASNGLDNAPFYAEWFGVRTAWVHVLSDPRNMENTDYVMIWGCNPIENQMRIAQNIVRARENGAKVVDVGLIYDGSAGYADEFYGIKPGMDAYLGMAMIKYVIDNNLQRDDYLLEKTVAAYLVNDADGMLARDAEGNYLVYDNASQSVKPVAPGRGAYPSDDIALWGCYDIEGGTAKTVLELIKERVEGYDFESVSQKTGIPAHDIEKIACDFAHAENAFILTGYGLRYKNAGETLRIMYLLGALTGRLGRYSNGIVQGLQVQSYPLTFNDAPILFPEGIENVKSVGMRMMDWMREARSEDSPYKAIIFAQGNPVHQHPDRNRWLDVLKNMELVVDFDIWLTDTGELSDYVLPDCMPFEREELITVACYNHIILQEAAIEPPEGCKPPVYFWSELAKRVGLGEYFDKTNEEWIDFRLQTDDPAIAGIEPKVDYARIKQEKMIRALVPEDDKCDFYRDDNMTFTPSGRIEIYAEKLTPFGLALPEPTKPLMVDDRPEEYPYQLFTGRQRFFMQSSYTHDPITIGLSGETPSTRVNPKDACELQLKDGDMVEVYNSMGHVVTRLEIDECVPAGTIHVWFGWRREQFVEGTYSEMVTPCGQEANTGEVDDFWLADWISAGHHINPCIDGVSAVIGGMDVYWDSVCNIRKYEMGA